jgi:hypothetical protein
MEEYIKKWEDNHAELLKFYTGIPESNEDVRKLQRSRMKDVLEFIEDLKKIKEVLS